MMFGGILVCILCFAWLGYRKAQHSVAMKTRLALYTSASSGPRPKPVRMLAARLDVASLLPDWIDYKKDRLMILAFLVSGIIVGSFLFGTLWGGVPTGLAAGALIARILSTKRKQRLRQQFLENFPAAVDSLARLVTAGQPIETALVDMGRYFPAPICDQFSAIGRKLELGIPFKKVLRDLSGFLDIAEFEYFCTVLIVNRDTGGRISEIMEHLSKSLREKSNSARQLTIMTSEPRSAARIVAMIPIGVLGLQWVSNPDRFYFLLGDPMGKLLLAYAVLSIATGLLIIRRMSALR